MKLKYYLRGLGIGIIVSTVMLMILSIGKAEKMTDEEVIVRAKELGMIENTVLLEKTSKDEEIISKDENMPVEDEQQDKETLPEEGASLEMGAQPELTAQMGLNVQTWQTAQAELAAQTEEDADSEDMTEQETDQTDQAEETAEPENIVQSEETVEPENPQRGNSSSYTFEIVSGQSSVSVSEHLKEIGLIFDSEEFDRYLCQNGYDKRISTGSFEISADASYEEIAKIITKSN